MGKELFLFRASSEQLFGCLIIRDIFGVHLYIVQFIEHRNSNFRYFLFDTKLPIGIYCGENNSRTFNFVGRFSLHRKKTSKMTVN